MELRIFAEPQEGASYEQQLAVAQAAEQLGFGAFFRSDHYLRIRPGDGAARADRRVDDARRARARDEHDPARARWSPRRRSGCPGRSRSRSRRSTR